MEETSKRDRQARPSWGEGPCLPWRPRGFKAGQSGHFAVQLPLIAASLVICFLETTLLSLLVVSAKSCRMARL